MNPPERRAPPAAMELRLPALLAGLPIVVYRCESGRPSARILYVSDAVHQLTGLSAGELIGGAVTRLRAIVHPHDLASYDAVGMLALRGEAPFTRRYRIVCADGGVRWVEEQGRAMPLRGGASRIVDGVILDISDRVHADAARAAADPLTGLANRDRFGTAVRDALGAEPPADVAVLYLDLDDFSSVNASLGHTAGDRLLAAVAARLVEAMDSTATAARMDGGKFAVLLRETDARGAERTAARLLDVLAAPMQIAGRELLMRGFVGIAQRSVSGGDHDDLIRAAVTAMHHARRAGTRVECFAPAMVRRNVDRVALTTALSRAIDRGELVVHYQPIVDLASGRIAGLEALVRWQHPGGALAPPSSFIPHAEAVGLIVPIGRLTLRDACEAAAGWRAELAPDLFVTVNVSARQLLDPDLVDDVRGALAAAGLCPSGLVLEITETALMGDADTAAARLTELTRLGVRIAIDDFGTGYSSLAYLRDLPVSILKLARPFVARVDAGERDRRIACSIVHLAEQLELDTVAEGIETPNQAEQLARAGCVYGQGFLFAKALPPDAIAALLRDGLRSAA